MQTTQDTVHSLLIIILYLAVFYGTVVAIQLVVRRVRTRSIQHSSSKDTPDSPILVSEIAPANTDLIGGVSGNTPAGMHYDYYVGGLSLFSSEQTRGLFVVELPLVSGVHLVGVPRNNPIPSSVSQHHEMEPVELEGTYNNHIKLFADKGQQLESRYVLDPTAMAFTLDFCDTFDWEIQEDTLYFMSAGTLPSFAIIDQFVEQIRPEIEVVSSRQKNPYRMSYTQMAGRTMHCPICQATLEVGEAWLGCVQGHGYLMTGGQLLEMNYGEELIPSNESPATAHGDLTCPYCSNPMKQTRYQQTSVDIDVCTRCMYRWADGGELATLFGR